ncbi:tuberoinfundibular peptide of 39 residues-like isoform X2 [Narcine bancroftii]|uniref:tuberoinfundibular peptide of 39 residues-like isoform X2 n=1 Tax=Narcine bancroftii TaxID=1343680 RepID=UPI003831091A
MVMEPSSSARMLVMGLILSCVPALCSGAAPASNGHTEKSWAMVKWPMEHRGVGDVMLDQRWPSDWLEPSIKEAAKRNVIADDVVFREKSKLLAAVERQKWLKSLLTRLMISQ